MGTQLCSFLRKPVKISFIMLSSLFLCIDWGGAFAALVCWSGGLSCLLHPLPLLGNWVHRFFTWFWLANLFSKIFLPHLIKCISSLPSLNPERRSRGPKRWNPVINTSYATSCWLTGFIHTSSSPFSHWQDRGESHQGSHALYHDSRDMQSPVVCSRSALAISLVATWKSSKR